MMKKLSYRNVCEIKYICKIFKRINSLTCFFPNLSVCRRRKGNLQKQPYDFTFCTYKVYAPDRETKREGPINQSSDIALLCLIAHTFHTKTKKKNKKIIDTTVITRTQQTLKSIICFANKMWSKLS